MKFPLLLLVALFALACANAPEFRAADAAPLPVPATGRIERLADVPSRHVPARHVDVWLPAGYPAQAPYDVLYAHDGQMLFDAAHTWNRQEWRMDEVAGALIAAGRVRPFIVVGIWNAGDDRHIEYLPQRAVAALDPAQQAALRAQQNAPGRPVLSGPVRSDAYVRFLVEELMPRIESQYAVARGPAHAAVLGSSMGGLISLYALVEHPGTFGAAACLSTHWPGAIPGADNPLPAAFLDTLIDRLPPPGAHRLWFDLGTATLDAHYPPLQAAVDARLAARGWAAPDWITRTYPGADHSETAWAERLADPLTFLFGHAAETDGPRREP